MTRIHELSPNKHRIFYGIGFILLLVCMGFLAKLWVGSQKLPRGPYLQSVEPTSVWVVWDTSKPSIGHIEYGLSPTMGLQEVDERVLTHHEIQLTNLVPYAQYFYRVEGEPIAQFRTAAPATQAEFSFAVYGDTREGASIHRAIIHRIVDMVPDFVIYTGDMVESGNCGSCWDEFFRIERPLLRSAPFYPTLGNHEDDQSPSDQTRYFDIFHLPGTERWYTFDYGNARFISLKVDGYPNGVYYPDQEQLGWLEDQLASNTQPWIFVFFHWGVFTSRGEDFLEVGMRSRLVPLFERYEVNAVFMGHNHGYERIVVNGITYITAAGGGASLYEMKVPEPGSQVADSEFNFLQLSTRGDYLTAQAFNNHGKVLDQFELSLGD
jgi:acid phosphatase type 7